MKKRSRMDLLIAALMRSDSPFADYAKRLPAIEHGDKVSSKRPHSTFEGHLFNALAKLDTSQVVDRRDEHKPMRTLAKRGAFEGNGTLERPAPKKRKTPGAAGSAPRQKVHRPSEARHDG